MHIVGDHEPYSDCICMHTKLSHFGHTCVRSVSLRAGMATATGNAWPRAPAAGYARVGNGVLRDRSDRLHRSSAGGTTARAAPGQGVRARARELDSATR